ncbi:cysteine--tRNA ligase [Gordonibacter massiliensis (ex Traore et al. 2017)]|uniref:Cysteine--tRNA ligase n=1 Tax=Gordonibacter massiliensis (ex Traore et al. 2017) TaxID=1841863 RepID=A0A842JJT9_9ACTN|nr:cysteine--tRNA ligase [Gordonibacter massiliensis (ex Traore et al. 2017)]MBC2890088.1 cysteine--tRNA ligase [Gordonibacter massiliensis (ex Traore et al. 2017)]
MIRLYNTKTRGKVDFETRERGRVGMYVCGPTVYNYIHIGNARTFISFDVIRRYLMWRGFDVTFVQNVTDVDDKIIGKANEEGRSAAEVAAEYTEAFIEDMHAAGVLDPDIRPKATEEIPSMIELIQELVDGGHAYEVDGDVYFSVRSFPAYGELSGRNIDEMECGHRELRADGKGIEDRKRDPLDFALWKAAKPGEPAWDSPWGQGRPGWHIECSAMSRKYLGLPFDIHGGGGDLVFPHHENERAQSEAACGCTFANYWMHGGMLQINSEKMSKSLGNFKLLRDVLKTTDAAVLRFLMLQTHYRSPLDFSEDRLAEAGAALGRIKNAVKNLDWLLENAQDIPSPLDLRAFMERTRAAKMAFILAMDDDFNTCKALGEVFDFIADVNAQTAGKTLSLADVPPVREARDLVVDLLGVLGVDVVADDAAAEGEGEAYPPEVVALAAEVAGYDGASASEAVDALLAARTEARAAKDWARADAVRDGLTGLGFVIEDTPQGARVSYEG